MKNTFILLALILITGCTSSTNVRKILKENPDIVFDVIVNNPEKFAEAATKASMAARRLSQSKSQNEAKEKLDEEFKNPKQPELSENRASQGPKNAPITVVEYSDFECPYCKKGFETLQEVQKKYPGKIRVFFKHLPLPFHPNALPAAKRFEAIALQSPEKAFQFHDKVFQNQSKLRTDGEKGLDSMAKSVGVNMKKMAADMNSNEVLSRIEADKAEASKFDINGTPGFLINGVALRGAYPPQAFAEIIDRHLSSSRDVSNQ